MYASEWGTWSWVDASERVATRGRGGGGGRGGKKRERRGGGGGGRRRTRAGLGRQTDLHSRPSTFGLRAGHHRNTSRDPSDPASCPPPARFSVATIHVQGYLLHRSFLHAACISFSATPCIVEQLADLSRDLVRGGNEASNPLRNLLYRGLIFLRTFVFSYGRAQLSCTLELVSACIRLPCLGHESPF